jgi:hypothetical protein
MSELRPLHTFFNLCWKQLGQANFNHADSVKKNYFLQKIEQNLQRKGKFLENEDAYLFFPLHFAINLSLQTCNAF